MGWCVGDGDTESLLDEVMSEQVQRPEVGVGLEVGGGARRQSGRGEAGGRAGGTEVRKLGRASSV